MTISKLDLIEKIMNFSGNKLSDEDLQSLINPSTRTPNSDVSSSYDYLPTPNLETPNDFKEQEKLFEAPELDCHGHTSIDSMAERDSIRPLNSFSQRRDFNCDANRETITVNIKNLLNPKEIPFGDLFHRKGSPSNKEIVTSDPWATILLGHNSKRPKEFPKCDPPEEVSVYYRDSCNNKIGHEEYLACLQLGNGLYKNYLANRPGLLWKQRTKSLISRFTNFKSPNVISLHVIRKVLENSGEIDYLKAMKEILKYNKCWVDRSHLEISYVESIKMFIQCKAQDQYENFKIYNSCDPNTLYSFKKDYKTMRRASLINIKFISYSFYPDYSIHYGKYLLDILYGEGTRQKVLVTKFYPKVHRLRVAIERGSEDSSNLIERYCRLLNKVEIFLSNNPNPSEVVDLTSLKSPTSTEDVLYNLDELSTNLWFCSVNK